MLVFLLHGNMSNRHAKLILHFSNGTQFRRIFVFFLCLINCPFLFSVLINILQCNPIVPITVCFNKFLVLDIICNKCAFFVTWCLTLIGGKAICDESHCRIILPKTEQQHLSLEEARTPMILLLHCPYSMLTGMLQLYYCSYFLFWLVNNSPESIMRQHS